ncbi:MAG: Rieske (2Fe-2S) protein [Candidatus Marinimicrobia bacterium]|nr:Rieske (2Fe-2S) protein [Candidatus Neomarinimicrobiota bacterium]MCH7762410.1 Rieske (2Fe-2S) protein [Candidatus Neomarinimicrobiota bacterium]
MIRVCHVDDLPERSSKIVMVQDTPVAVINAGGNIFAWDNRCPHRGASLGDGHITDTTVQCKFHLWEFDIKRECAVANDAIKIKSFPVEIIEGEIFVKI